MMDKNINNLTPQQLRKLKKLADVIDKGNVAFLEHLFEIEETIDEKIASLEAKIPDVENVVSSVRGKQGKAGDKGERGDKGDKGDKGDTGPAGRDGKDSTVAGPQGPKGEKGDSVVGTAGKDGKDGADGNIKDIAPQEVRDLLELLKDDERLSIDAIKDLREELDKVRKGGQVGGGGVTSRDVFKDYDLSPYLDGVSKTFNIPAVWNIISVDTSSFPHALRKNVDYTYTSQTITFTSEIDETTVLAQGQTVILTIVSG